MADELPWRSDQDAFIGRFNRASRGEALDAYLFDFLDRERGLTEALHATPQDRAAPCQPRPARLPPLTFLPGPETPAKSTLGEAA